MRRSSLSVGMSFMLIALLSGCASKKHVAFVTRTSISVAKIDTTPPEINIGANRVEAFVGPAYANGGAPPVFALMDTNASILNPEVEQVYATGAAAEIITGGTVSTCPPKLTGKKKIMFFGTNFLVGLKLGLNPTNNIPTLDFGYTREELSIIPIGHDGTKEEEGNEDIYPSVLASIDLSTDSSDSGAGVKVATLFATGTAAINQAEENPALKALVNDVTKTRIATVTENYDNAKLVTFSVIDAYDRLDSTQKNSVIKRASLIGLMDPNTIKNIRKAGDDGVRDTLFLNDLLLGEASDTARVRKLTSLLNYIQTL